MRLGKYLVQPAIKFKNFCGMSPSSIPSSILANIDDLGATFYLLFGNAEGSSSLFFFLD
jgi:hypothetical protein